MIVRAALLLLLGFLVPQSTWGAANEKLEQYACGTSVRSDGGWWVQYRVLEQQTRSTSFQAALGDHAYNRPALVVESWGHAYLVFRGRRYDGHLLGRWEASDFTVANPGVWFAFPDLGAKQGDVFAARLEKTVNAKTLSCIHEAASQIRAIYGLESSRHDPISAREFFEWLMLLRGSSTGASPPVVELIQTDAALPVDFLAKFDRISDDWLADYLEGWLSNHPGPRLNLTTAPEIAGQLEGDPVRRDRLVEYFKKRLVEDSSLASRVIEQDPQEIRTRLFERNLVDLEREMERVRKAEVHPASRGWTISPEQTAGILREARDQSRRTEWVEVTQESIDAVKRPLDRYTSANDHTQQVNEYIERHLPARLMRYLLSNPQIEIVVYSGSLPEVVSHLADEGFGELELLAKNRLTDFDVLIGKNRSEKKIRVVLKALPGVSTELEAVANLLYYSRPAYGRRLMLNSDRIRILRSKKGAIERFQEALSQWQVDPSLVVFGYSRSTGEVLTQLGAREIRVVKSEEFFARIYEWNGRHILSLNVEPQYAGTRAGDFVTALSRFAPGAKPKIVFFGSAGTMSPSVRVGDFVVGRTIYRSESSTGISLPGPFSPSVREVEVVSVESLLFEDRRWLEAHRGRGRRLARVVEQEAWGVASAAQAAGLEVTLVYRVSDDLNQKELDFARSEHQLVEDARLRNLQETVLKRSLPKRK